MNTEQLAEALAATGDTLWAATLTDTPWGRSAQEWMSAPRPGDLVLVIYPNPVPAIQRVGTYTGAWTHIPLGGTRSEVHEIECLDGECISWSNVRIVRIPRHDAEHLEVHRRASELV
jgi:hypothetical protein